MSATNKHGLSRHIEEAVKRQLRQEAGFGCIKCGYIRGEYEHIDPEFVEAKSHDPAKMAFLCGRCHGEVTARAGFKERVWEWKRNPYSRQRRETKPFEIEPDAAGCAVQLGLLEFRDCSALLTLNGDCVLSVAAPGPGESMLRISGRFFDKSGKPVLVIESSAIQLNVENWDVTLEGEHLRIWSALRKPVLDLELGPPALRVHLLRTVYQGVDVTIAPDVVQLGANQLRLASGSSLFVGCVSCVSGSSEEIILGDAVEGRGNVVLKENGQVEFIRCTFMGGLRAIGHGDIKLDGCTFHGRRSPETKRKRLSRGWAFDAVTVAGGGKTARIRRSSVQALWASSSWPGVRERHPARFSIATHVLMFGHAFPSEVPQVAAELRDILLEIKRLRVELPTIVEVAEREGFDERERATLRATATSFEHLLRDEDVAALIYVAEHAARAGTELTIT